MRPPQMTPETRERLLQINRLFYEQHAQDFAATRFGSQPGWTRIIPYFPRRCQVLDLGCGNGRFAHFLDTHLSETRYLGLDGSEGLVEIARQRTAGLRRTQAEFQAADLSQPDWARHIGAGGFDVVMALAVLHHIPGFDARSDLLRSAAACLAPTGRLILSTWRFTHSPRLRRKIRPWDAIGLTPADVDSGDYLLDWQADGLRYVHELDEAEAAVLATAAGLQVVEQFRADGREGDLSLYSVLRGFQLTGN